MGVVGVIALSLLKNLGIIVYLSTVKSYRTFRAWLHKKWGKEEYLKNKRRSKRLTNAKNKRSKRLNSNQSNSLQRVGHEFERPESSSHLAIINPEINKLSQKKQKKAKRVLWHLSDNTLPSIPKPSEQVLQIIVICHIGQFIDDTCQEAKEEG